MDEKDCGCQHRKDLLNQYVPGLVDSVEQVANPIYSKFQSLKGENAMTSLLKPDMKAIVWLAIGAFVVPIVLKKL